MSTNNTMGTERELAQQELLATLADYRDLKLEHKRCLEELYELRKAYDQLRNLSHAIGDDGVEVLARCGNMTVLDILRMLPKEPKE